jgi:hypothetical protein
METFHRQRASWNPPFGVIKQVIAPVTIPDEATRTGILIVADQSSWRRIVGVVSETQSRMYSRWFGDKRCGRCSSAKYRCSSASSDI